MTKQLREAVKNITYRQKDRTSIFLELDLDQRLKVLGRLSKHVQTLLLTELKNEEVVPLLEHLDPDDSTDLLQTLPPKRQKALLSEMSLEMQNTLSMLLQFDPQTAAGLMSLNYIQVDTSQKLTEVAEQVHIHEKRTGKLPVTLILENGKLIGFLPLQQLLFTKPSDRVSNLVKKIQTIKHTASSKSVINHFLDNPHQKIAVLGEKENIIGVLYSDDVLKILQEREVSTLYDFAGLHKEEGVTDSVKMKVRHRYKWLIINLGTSFLAAFTVGLFNETISKYVLLAVYMPIVAGMGGNAATQTLAILVRGITLKQIELKSALPTLRKELGAGLINGTLNGIIVFLIVAFFNRDVKVGIVLASAMIINLLVASFFGTIVPLVMKKLGKDPATSATIFITTATDVLGFLAFLGIATMILD